MKRLFVLLVFLASVFSMRAAVHTVQVADFAFTPATVNAICGDSILWIWVSGTHTTTSVSIPVCANGWNSPITSSIGSFLYIAQCSGTYLYECTAHPGMTGTIQVACATGTEDLALRSAHAHPNPFTERLTVQTGGNDHIVVTDILGRVLKTVDVPPSQEELVLHLPVPRGVYLVRFYYNGMLTVTRKLVHN